VTQDACVGVWQLPRERPGRREPWEVAWKPGVLHEVCDDGGDGDVGCLVCGGGGARAAQVHCAARSIVVHSRCLVLSTPGHRGGGGDGDD